MDERNYYFMNRSHIRAFGSWDCNDDFPIPFTECFESADLFRYSYSKDPDLYQNDIVTPAMIVLPPPKRKAKQDFYKISPQLLYASTLCLKGKALGDSFRCACGQLVLHDPERA